MTGQPSNDEPGIMPDSVRGHIFGWPPCPECGAPVRSGARRHVICELLASGQVIVAGDEIEYHINTGDDA